MPSSKQYCNKKNTKFECTLRRKAVNSDITCSRTLARLILRGELAITENAWKGKTNNSILSSRNEERSK